jgi:hypothetical protein
MATMIGSEAAIQNAALMPLEFRSASGAPKVFIRCCPHPVAWRPFLIPPNAGDLATALPRCTTNPRNSTRWSARTTSVYLERWNNERGRDDLVRVARICESEPSMIGCSAHLLIVARKSRGGS